MRQDIMSPPDIIHIRGAYPHFLCRETFTAEYSLSGNTTQGGIQLVEIWQLVKNALQYMIRRELMKGDKCSINGCDKLAIEYESHPGGGYNVCEEHCSTKILKLKPGETQRDSVDYYHRYKLE